MCTLICEKTEVVFMVTSLFKCLICAKTLTQKERKLLLLFFSRQVFATPWTAARHSPCPSLSPGLCPSSCPLNRRCHPTTSSFVALFLCPQSFPASGSFPMSQLFASGGQSNGVSASVLPMCTQNWFPLGLTGLNSLQSKGLSSIFSSITVWKNPNTSLLDSLKSWKL